MKRFLIAGITLVLFALVLVLLLEERESKRPTVTSDPAAASVPAGTETPAAEPDETTDPDGAAELAAADESTPSREAATRVEPEHAGPWIEGTVELDGACASDPTLEVVALSSAHSHGAMLRAVERDGWVRAGVDLREIEGDGAPDPQVSAVVARASVGADGSFRIPVASAETEVHLAVLGRVLYSERTTRARADTAAVRLAVQRGALVRVRLRAADGAPLGKVDVLCGQEDAAPDAGEREVRLRTRADAAGTRELRALPSGTAFTLTVLPEHHAARKVTVRPLDPCEEIQLDVELARGGAVAGRVLDETDAPVAGATVGALWPGRYFGFDALELRDEESDAEGRFRIAGLPAGELSLQAQREGMLTSTRVKIEIAPEGTREDVVLRLTGGAVVAGRVTWQDGSPAADVRVEIDVDVARLGQMDWLSMQRGNEADVDTDAEGRFRASGLGKGPFIVQCSATKEDGTSAADGAAPSAAASSEHDAHSLRPSAPREGGDAPVFRARATAVAGGTEDVLLVLAEPPGLWGQVVDPRGDPVTAFEAEVSEAGGGMFAAFASERRSERFESPDGRFYFGDLRTGRWQVSARASGYATAAPVEIDLPGSSETSPLVVALVPTATVRGVVLSPTGDPVSAASVHETRGGGGMDALFENMRRRESAPKTDAEGRFEIESLLPGSASFHAEAEGWARGPAVALDLVGGEAIDGVELRLLVGGTLTGEVYDKEGEPAAGRLVTAQLLAEFQQRSVRSDADGLFRIEHMPPGSWQISSLDGAADWAGGGELDPAAMLESMELAQATIQDGEETHVVLGGAPKNPIRVHGRVTLLDEPYGGAMVTFAGQSERPLESMQFATADQNGEYEITLEGAGRYVVNISRLTGVMGQQNTTEMSAEIPDVPEHELDFELPHGRISGRVYGPDGEPVPGARITLSADGVARTDNLFGGHYTEIQTDAEGRYDVTALRAGVYRVSAGGAAVLGFGAEAVTGRQTRGGLELGEEQWLRDVDFHLPAPGDLEVVVRDASGAPAPGATVFVRDESGHVSEAMSFHQTDSAGRSVYTGLAPGRYTALARASGLASEESEPVEVREGERARVEIRLAEGAILWVRFRVEDGAEVPAHVQVTDSSGRDVTALLGMADIQALYAEGAFSPTEYRVGPLAPGKYKIRAWTDDGKTAKKNVVIEAGEREQRFTVELDAD